MNQFGRAGARLCFLSLCPTGSRLLAEKLRERERGWRRDDTLDLLLQSKLVICRAQRRQRTHLHGNARLPRLTPGRLTWMHPH
jgi:hypothetical protein